MGQPRRQTPKGIGGIHPTVIDALRNYSWPGNIRELSNLIERLAILCPERPVTIGDLPSRYRPADWTPPVLPETTRRRRGSRRRRAGTWVCRGGRHRHAPEAAWKKRRHLPCVVCSRARRV